MTIEEKMQCLNCYLDKLEKEIETLKENISEVKENIEKVQTYDDLELIKYYDLEKGLTMIELV